jgi:hypothetical protein
MHFSGEFTMGNIVILAVMVFGFGVSWTRVGSDIKAIKEWIKSHLRAHESKDKDLEDLKLDFARHEGRENGKAG